MQITDTRNIQLHFGGSAFMSTQNSIHKKLKNLKNSQIDLGIFGVCYMHNMLNVFCLQFFQVAALRMMMIWGPIIIPPIKNGRATIAGPPTITPRPAETEI